MAKKLYRWAGTTDRKRMSTYVNMLLKYYPKGSKNLEIGCGKGNMMEVLHKERKVKSVGVEPDKLEREQATKRGFKVFDCDANKPLPFKDNSFDAVTMISILEHIHNARGLVAEARRILKPGGICIVQVPNPYFPIDLHYLLPLWGYLPKPLRDFYVKCFIPKDWPVYYHVVRITARDIKRIFKDFKLVKFMTYFHEKEIVPYRYRRLYSIFRKIQLDKILPMGFIYIYKKP